MLKNTQGNFFLSSMWAAEGRTDFCHVVWEWVNYDIFDQESVQFYWYFGEKVWDKNVPLPLKENAYLESVLKFFWKYFSFPEFTSIVAADGDVCLFGNVKPFPCRCVVGESIGCRMQGGLGVIHHGFSMLFGVVLGFVLFFILKSSVEILNALLPFCSSLYSFSLSPPPLVSEGPLFCCCWGSRLELQRVGSAVWSFQRLYSSLWLLGWFVTRYFFGVFVCPVVC